MSASIAITLLGILATCLSAHAEPATPAFTPLQIGEVMPRGWLREQILTDATNGYGPVLDRLTERCDLTVFDCRHKSDLARPKRGEVWWNGETTGNWLDGLVRTAHLSGDEKAKRQVDEYVARILAMQEADGYLGTYPPRLRFEQPITANNGELWSQTCLFRGLLAYYELTGKREVLEAVERASKLMISKYGAGKPYWNEGIVLSGGGPGHNLMFVDICEWLYRLTDNKRYVEFAQFLYDGYSQLKDCRERDIQLSRLADMNHRFTGHAAHVMEHLRVPLFVYYATGDTQYRAAVGNVFPKTARHLSAGGACIGDEGIGGRPGSPNIGCEYCTMLELLHSLQSGVQKTGDAALADRIEVLAFNAAEGARQRDGKANQYCTRDNQSLINSQVDHKRANLSPTHDAVAVCCPVTSLKFFPYFVNGLWMKTREGVAAINYAPNELRTRINGVDVRVLSETAYPFEDAIRLIIATERPVTCAIRLRVPGWAVRMNVEATDATLTTDGHWRVLTREWRTGDRIVISFAPNIERKAITDEVYWQRGALVYALPIATESKPVKSYPVPGFADYEYLPRAGAFWNYAVDAKTGIFHFTYTAVTVNPWIGSPVRLTGQLLNRQTGKPEKVELQPMGTHLLRRVTFQESETRTL